MAVYVRSCVDAIFHWKLTTCAPTRQGWTSVCFHDCLEENDEEDLDCEYYEEGLLLDVTSSFGQKPGRGKLRLRMLPHAWLETWSNRVCPCFAATLSKGAMISLPSNFPLLTYKLTSSIADAPALRIRCRSIHANEEGLKVLQAIYLMAFLSASTSDFTATSLHLYLGCNPITMSRKKNRYRTTHLEPMDLTVNRKHVLI